MTSETDIAEAIADYVIRTKEPKDFDMASLPRDQSLVELGILDSFGVVELIEFLEQTWRITIADDEITKERMGSINKMAGLVKSKLSA